MNLTDREILELNELCNAVVDETLTDAQRARLCAWLTASEAARQYYVRSLAQSASLHSYASEMHAEAPRLIPAPRRGPFAAVFWLGGSLAAAAALAFVLWVAARGPRAEAAPGPAALRRHDRTNAWPSWPGFRMRWCWPMERRAPSPAGRSRGRALRPWTWRTWRPQSPF